MALSGSIEDRLKIMELYGKYGSTSAKMDREGWLACWSEDAQWHSHLFACVGNAEIAAQYDQIVSAFSNLFFIATVGPIEIDGHQAKGGANAMEVASYKEGGGFFTLAGVYDDLIERRDGTWLFVRRDYRPLVQDF